MAAVTVTALRSFHFNGTRYRAGDTLEVDLRTEHGENLVLHGYIIPTGAVPAEPAAPSTPPPGVPMEQGGAVYMRPGYSPSETANGTTDFAGYLNFMPIYVAAKLNVFAAAVEVVTAGTGSARVGLYEDRLAAGGTAQHEMIGPLIHDFGALSGAATGTIASPDLATPIVLTPGYYWLGTVISTAVTIRTMHETSQAKPVRPAHSAANAQAMVQNVPALNTGEAIVANGLPNPLPTTGWSTISVTLASGGFLKARLAA